MSSKEKTASKPPADAPPRPEVAPGLGGPVRNPNSNDVLSGRGGRINSHAGNVRFREMVDSMKREYLDPRTKKLEKARIAARLVASIRHSDPPGRFLKEDPHTGLWIEIGDERAWKKAGQALRESAPEIRAEQQAALQAAVAAAGMAGGGVAALSAGTMGMKSSSPVDFDDVGSGGDGRGGRMGMGVGNHMNSQFMSNNMTEHEMNIMRMKNLYRGGGGGGGGSRGSSRQASDPPGPRHRPNPPEREGLARSRQDYERDHFQDRGNFDELELNRMRHFSQSQAEYLQQQRMQLKQQLMAQQLQERYRDRGGFDDFNMHPQDQFQQRCYPTNDIAAAISNDDLLPLHAGFVIPSIRGEQNQQDIHQQEMHQQEMQRRQLPPQQQYRPEDDDHDFPQAAEAFDRQYIPISSGATVSTMSDFDVQSMDMSSLGGFSFTNQSLYGQSNNHNMSMMSGLISTGSQVSRGGASMARKQRKSALERKLEKVNEAHRMEMEKKRRAEGQKMQGGQLEEAYQVKVPTHQEHSQRPLKSSQFDSSFQSKGHGVSLTSFGFEAIEEDDRTNTSGKRDDLGVSEMSCGNMTFGSDVLSIKSRSYPNLRNAEMPPPEAVKKGDNGKSQEGGSKVAPGSSEHKASGSDAPKSVSAPPSGGLAPVTASSLFDQSCSSNGTGSSRGASSSSVSTNINGAKKSTSSSIGFGDSSQFNMDNFNESFKSMEMEDRGTPNRGGPRGSGLVDPPSGDSSRRAVGSRRQQDPSGGRLPTHAARGVVETTPRHQDNAGNSGRDPDMGASDFGISFNSIKSFQSQSSDNSSWLNQYSGMEGVGNDKNPWDDEDSRGSSLSEISAPRMVSVDH